MEKFVTRLATVNFVVGLLAGVLIGILLANAAHAAPSCAQGDLPDPACTPGAYDPVPLPELCGKVQGLTYEKRRRAALTQGVKDAITRSYGYVPGTRARTGDYELDHLVPAALGGRSDAVNVWYQLGRGRGTAWDYHVKDRLDTLAWHKVCVTREWTQDQGAAAFVPDWRAGYCKLIGGKPCP
jgi:hypothetical protein